MRESQFPPSGPTLRYTNERAREMEQMVDSFARLVNDDLYDLLRWANELRQDRDRFRDALVNVRDMDGASAWEYREVAENALKDGYVWTPTLEDVVAAARDLTSKFEDWVDKGWIVLNEEGRLVNGHKNQIGVLQAHRKLRDLLEER